MLVCSCKEFYVSAPNGTSCPNSSILCNELAFYINFSESYFTNDTIFYFLEGTHSLEEEKMLLINGVHNITLQGLGEMVQGFHETVMESTVKITCHGASSAIVFLYSIGVNIQSLTISECSIYASLVNPVRNTLFPDTRVALGFFETYNISINNCSIQNNTGAGLILINAFGVTIASSFFSNNKVRGNVLIVNTNPTWCLSTSEMQIYGLDIFDSFFSFGEGAPEASGITIILEQNCAYKVDIKLVRVTAYANRGNAWGNIGLATAATVLYYSLVVDSMVSSRGRSNNAGAGMLINIGTASDLSTCLCSYKSPSQTATPIIIQNSQFFKNVAVFGAGFILSTQRTENVTVSQQIIIESSQFYDNVGYAGSGVYITQAEILPLNSPLSFVLGNLTINNNVILDDHPSCAMFLYNVELAYIHNARVFNNNDTGILVYDSVVMFLGLDNKIYNNNASRGGGIAVYGNSILIISNGTYIDFLNNHAIELGGGIYINSKSPFLRVCRIQFAYLRYDSLPDSRLYFANNTAGIAGSALYGGMLDDCQNLLDSSSQHVKPSLLHQLINVTDQLGSSVVSSDAVDICFCVNNFPNCSDSLRTMYFSAYPGDFINIQLVAIGQRRGFTEGFISLNTLYSSPNQFVIQIPPSCSNINHTVTKVGDNNTSITVSIGIVDPNQLQSGVPKELLTINISILPCPPGFSISSDSGTCDCANILHNSHIQVTCNITANAIIREGNSWIGYNEQDHCIIIKNECPFDYCKTSSVTFNITSPDPQCALNRSGLLCAQCAEGLSLMLGSNQCGQCTNDYLALIIPFGLAGITLVVFLIVLNLTVSVGTINGLIFYANVVKINETIFFPNGPIPLISQFISWLNLDLGIETCFFNGMNAYSNTWLQFAFPFYIWLIIGVITYACHLSTRISKLVGNNAVPVLATLVLLSFTKLFSTIILVFHLTVIRCESLKLYRWSLDTSMHYFSLLHAILFLTTIVILFCLAVPYMLLLLLNPIIGGKISDFPLCKCCVKLKPFFDAYYGPFKDKYRYWTGLLLLIRILLLGISFANRTTTFTITISFTAILVTLEAFVGGVYQKTYLNILEVWFFCLLIIQATLANNSYGYVGSVVVTSIALMTFGGIVCYHLYHRFQKVITASVTKLVKRKSIIRSNSNLEKQLIAEGDTFTINNASSGTTKDIVQTSVQIRRRESLLLDVVSDSYQSNN